MLRYHLPVLRRQVPGLMLVAFVAAGAGTWHLAGLGAGIRKVSG